MSKPRIARKISTGADLNKFWELYLSAPQYAEAEWCSTNESQLRYLLKKADSPSLMEFISHVFIAGWNAHNCWETEQDAASSQRLSGKRPDWFTPELERKNRSWFKPLTQVKREYKAKQKARKAMKS